MYRRAICTAPLLCAARGCQSREASLSASSWASADDAVTPRFRQNTVVTENRFSTWCKRLWQLSSISSASASPHAPRDVPDAEAALLSMHDVLSMDGQGHLPATFVDAVWQTYDTVFPPRLLTDLAANVTPREAGHFFSFLQHLTEVNYNVPAVRQLSDRLSAELQALNVSGADTTRRASSSSDSHHEASARTAAGGTVEVRLERVTQLCLDLQAASSPLYYTWMRESAALENGLRRLMDFRKTVHFFDVMCKNEIKRVLKARQTEPSSASPASDDATQAPVSSSSSSALSLSTWQARHQDVKRIDRALTNLFHDFFRKEYLVMEELSWHTTPPSLLEQIMAAESVQPFVRGLSDMKYRMQPTHHRHLFAFLHPSVVEEPLIAVQVALTKGVARSVDHLLSHPTPLLDPANQSYAAMRFKAYEASFQQDGGPSPLNEKVDSAIFYSINSAQSALRGMDMGNMLIKRVVREVEERVNTSRRTRGLETIRTFSTLSPIPGFVRWLAGEVESMERQAQASSATTATATVNAFASNIFGTRLRSRREECCRTLVTALRSFAVRHDLASALHSAATMPTSGPTSLLSDAHSAVAELLESSCSSPATPGSGDGDGGGAGAAAPAPSPTETLRALRLLVRLLQHPELFPIHNAGVASPPNPTGSHAATLSSWWWWDPIFTTAMERPLLTSAAHYLYQIKKADGRILDSVGNFHVSNGATMYRLNYLGNAGAQGSRESACMMVNYWYNLETISSNVRRYDDSHAVAVHTHITSLLEE